jgi:hypothetical protein
LPNETKADYVLVQVNATGKTLQVDRIRIWGIFGQINSSVEFNETIYKGLSLYVSKNNGTSMFINDTKTDPIINYWEITAKNCSLMPIDEQTLLNFTFVFDLPPGCYNESVLFNYTPVMRFTSFV